MVLQGDFARLCFQKMTSDHLGRMQDSYEMFVLCACARRFETITDFQGLHYNFGNGCSGNTEETAQQFVAMQLSAKQLNNHIAEFADSTDSVVIKQCAQWLEEEYVRIIGNDWVIRLNAENQQATILNVVETWELILLIGFCQIHWMREQNGLLRRSKFQSKQMIFIVGSAC